MLDLDQEKNPEVLRQVAKLAMADNRRLVERIAALTEELAKLRGKDRQEIQLELNRLHEQLAELRSELYGHSSERRPRGEKQGRGDRERTGHGPKEQIELGARGDRARPRRSRPNLPALRWHAGGVRGPAGTE